MFIGIRIRSLHFVSPKNLDYMQKYNVLPEYCGHRVVGDLADVTQLNGDQAHLRLVRWLHYFFAFT